MLHALLVVLWTIYVIICALLIVLVLLQPAEGGDLGAAFGVGSSQTLFGARGALSFMGKATAWLGGIWMALSLILLLLSNTGKETALERVQEQEKAKEKTPASAPAEPKAKEDQPASGSAEAGDTAAATEEAASESDGPPAPKPDEAPANP